MSISNLSQRHGGAIVLATLFLVLAGVLALPSLPSDIYPPLTFPRIVIVAHSGSLPGRSMLLSVTRPLEESIMEVPGIRRVRSKTFRGAAEISAQFEPRTDIVLALQQVQNRVAEVRQDLPEETELAVERLTPTTFPILSYNLTGKISNAKLYDFAFFTMRPSLARVPGVGRVEVMASDTNEVEVVVDPDRLLAAGLSAGDVAEALRSSNQLGPMAHYTAEGKQFLVLGSGLVKSIAGLNDIPVVTKAGATVRVRDVADVFAGAPDRTVLVTGGGEPAALINVSQQIGARILAVRDGVEMQLRELARTLPSGLRITKVYDLAGFVEDAIGSVRDAILIGGLLAVVVLFVFLRDWRVTAIAALTLPLTVLSTFLFMKLFGETINLMSMGGLAVAIGLVIDDAVVVVENIHRHLARGEGPAAIEKATAELVAPVVGSTLTTVVVFAPLGLLTGVVGQFFRALSITLSVSVVLSLALALTLIPLLTRWASRHEADEAEVQRGAAMERRYAAALHRVIDRPRWVAIAALVLVLVAVLLQRVVPTGFLPHMDEGGFVIDYLTPPGTAIEESDRLIKRVEKILAQTPEVASFSRRTGSELGLFATQQNKGDVVVRLKGRGDRSRTADQVIEDLRPKLLEAVPGLEIEFVQLLQDMLGDLEGNPTPIEVKVFGDDPDVLAELAEQIEPKLAKVAGVVDLVGMGLSGPEQTWDIDAVAAGRLGLTVRDVQSQVSRALMGDVATELRVGDRAIPVRVHYPDAVRFDPAQLGTVVVRGAESRIALLQTLATVRPSTSAVVLERENLRQMAILTARLEDRDLGSAVADVQKLLDGIKLPVGYTAEVGGQFRSQQAAFREILTVLGIATGLVLLVLAVEFRSVIPAFLILAAAPLSFGGALVMLLITGTELNVSSAMGFILLIGLVVKNGIVMIDYAHHLRDGGMPFEEAMASAARIRLRPILMTTLCTLFGLLPLALGLGAGAELQKPLALVVIGGLSLSTAVTLFAVPTAYVAIARWRGRGAGASLTGG